jgi:hypothetical protein
MQGAVVGEDDRPDVWGVFRLMMWFSKRLHAASDQACVNEITHTRDR